MGTITDNFEAYEFRCRCGTCEYSEGEGISFLFVRKLQAIRDIYKHPMPISSGVRCEAHNRAVGGAKGSQHLFGKAADIAITDPVARAYIVRLALNLGLSVGLNARFIHLDNRSHQIMFLY